MRKNPWLIPLLLVASLAWFWWSSRDVSSSALPHPDATEPAIERTRPATPLGDRSGTSIDLPAEAHDTIALVQRGGPFPHRQDGVTFGNRERRLPQKPRGWYREYTVDTPGLGHRGARRIVTGGRPPSEWYYTDDHYDSFRRFEVRP